VGYQESRYLSQGQRQDQFDYAVIASRRRAQDDHPRTGAFGFLPEETPRAMPGGAGRAQIPISFTPNELPGGVPQPSQQEIQQYFTAPESEYSTPEQASSRHILIKVAPGADAKTDAAAKAKAEGILKQIQGGATLRISPRNTPTIPAARTRR